MIIFQQSRIERSSTVIAFGGGVVGDMTGFAASVCLRGIGYIQVPTSLLAMVDSSVGGKTAVDHPLGKNLIGAFYQPKLVYIDTDFLNTLSERDFLSGYAELFKYAFIGGRKMFDFIMNNNETMLRKESGILLEGISHSIETKARVVEQDQFETSGLRALLNFGHTFAHSLERFTIDLENLVLTLSCSDEDTIYDTTMLSGTGGEDFTINVGNLAAPKQWRVTAASYDQNDSCIHFGSESFITEPADTVDVALNLSARYSMLRVSFIGIPDSVLALSVILNGAVTLDTSFTVAGSTDTAVLWYDYIDASPEGNNHLVSMRIRGVYHGINTILFSADTSISVVSGEDHEYTVTLGWVGPYINNAPVFTSEPSNMVDSVIAGSRYLDTVHVYDPDSDAVTLSLSGTLLADSILNVPTTLADTGTYPIQLIASDGNGGYDTLEWTIFIVPPPASNHSLPVITQNDR